MYPYIFELINEIKNKDKYMKEKIKFLRNYFFYQKYLNFSIKDILFNE